MISDNTENVKIVAVIFCTQNAEYSYLPNRAIFVSVPVFLLYYLVQQ
jgi:hypothetical protein